jgi:hypothetical protein
MSDHMRKAGMMKLKLFSMVVALVLSWPVTGSADSVSQWNQIAVQTSLTAGENAVVQSRTLAMAQAAVHDALNAIDRRYEPYTFVGNAPGALVDAAVATAAHDALVAAVFNPGLPFPVFPGYAGFGTPAQQANAVAQVTSTYNTFINGIPASGAKTAGIVIGAAAAAAIIALRSTDHATTLVSYTPGTRPGDWQPTPNPVPFDPPAPADHQPAGLPGWGAVTTWVLHAGDQFGPNGPPALRSPHYKRDYNEVKAIGTKNSVERTPEQTSIARFWYENSPAAWSRIANVAADSAGLDTWDRARLLALVNLAMADGFIGGFAAKYTFNFWRPVTAIRAGDTDGNDNTVADPTWDSLLNTPAIPDYPSTHSVLGGAASRVLRRFFGTDNVPFTTMSGVPFAGMTRSFASFSEAARENGESRIYAGIHFRSAVEEGIAQGEKIGQFVFEHSLRATER